MPTQRLVAGLTAPRSPPPSWHRLTPASFSRVAKIKTWTKAYSYRLYDMIKGYAAAKVNAPPPPARYTAKKTTDGPLKALVDPIRVREHVALAAVAHRPLMDASPLPCPRRWRARPRIRPRQMCVWVSPRMSWPTLAGTS